MKITINIQDDIFFAADNFAAQAGLSRSQLYQLAIRQFLTQQDSMNITKMLNSVYSKPEKNKGLHSTIATLQSTSLAQNNNLETWLTYPQIP